MTQRVTYLVLLCLCLLVSACSTPKPATGYLTRNNGFRPGPEVAEIWTAHHVENRAQFQALLAPYDKILLDPVWTNAYDEEAYDGLEGAKLKALVGDFNRLLRAELAKRHQLVDQAGPGVLRISIGLTAIERPNRVLATTSTFMPFGLAMSGLKRVTTGEHSNVGSASMEMVARDALTGQSLFAVRDRRAGSKDLAKIFDTSADARKAFEWWAKRLAETL